MNSLADASLTDAEGRVLRRVLERLKAELGADLHAVWLYGSRARGEPPEGDSDVDLLVITRGGRIRDLPVVTRIVVEEGGAEPGGYVDVSAHVHDPDWVAQRRAIDSFFMREVDRDKIVLVGEP